MSDLFDYDATKVVKQYSGVGLLGGISAGIALAGMLYRYLNRDMIADIEVQCLIEETHTKQLNITNHPVDAASVISDHAFMEPQTVTIECIYSSSLLSAATDILSAASPDVLWKLDNIYKQFCKLQAERQLITVATTKQVYENMLIEKIEIPVNKQSFGVLHMIISLREIILVKTRAAKVDADFTSYDAVVSQLETGTKNTTSNTTMLNDIAADGAARNSMTMRP